METRDESGEGHQQNQNYEPPAHLINVVPDQPNTTESAETARGTNNKINKYGWRRTIKRLFKPMRLYTFLLVVVAGLQWWVTRGQLQEMKDDGARAKQLVEAAKAAAEAAKKSAEVAEKTLNSNVEFFKVSRRPQISVWKVEPMKPFVKGQPLFVGIDVASNGQSAALRFKGHFHVQSGKTARGKIGKIGRLPPEGKHFDLAHGQPHGFIATTLTDPMDEASQPVPWDGEFPVYVFGEMEYWDEFGKRYPLTFCREWNRIHGVFASCPFYNSTEPAQK